MMISSTSNTIEMQSELIQMCIDAASASKDAVDAWRKQRRTLERMPSHLSGALLHNLLRRGLLFPSLLEVFKYSIEEIDFRGENCVDAEWMAYLGAFHFLHSLNLADCYKVNSAALWAITGMSNLRGLDLSRCSKITDGGIRHLLSIPSLEKLCIPETGVTAKGVVLLSSLTNLSILDLGGLPVTDLALSSLQGLKHLQYLDLWGTEISNGGATLFKLFPRLSILNVAWTSVTKLPVLTSLKSLNMSNCTIDTIFEGEGDKVALRELIITGSSVTDVSFALSNVLMGCLSFLDISNSSINSFFLLGHLNVITHLDLGGSSILDDSVQHIASIGSNLRYLNLSTTRVSSTGLGILAGHLPNLETLVLAGTSIDDTAISYIGTMPSLKVVNLNSTGIKGLINREIGTSTWFSTLSLFENLSCLERLQLEGTNIRDAALCPLSRFHALRYLSVGSGYLTDASLQHLTSLQKLVHLGIHDAVLTNVGLDCFNPPPTLEVLDLMGCWLLTIDDIMSFCNKHLELEVRHDLVTVVPPNKGSCTSSLSRATSRSSQPKQRKMLVSPARFTHGVLVDQRLRYTREELLALQFSSTFFSLETGRFRGEDLPH